MLTQINSCALKLFEIEKNADSKTGSDIQKVVKAENITQAEKQQRAQETKPTLLPEI